MTPQGIKRDRSNTRKRGYLPWEKSRAELSRYDFMIAVGHHPEHRDRPRDLRVAQAILYLLHGESGITWQSQQTICQLSQLGNKSQCFRSLKALEATGAIRIRPLAEMPADLKQLVSRDGRGKFYELNMDWVFATLQQYALQREDEPSRLQAAKRNRMPTQQPIFDADRVLSQQHNKGAESAPLNIKGNIKGGAVPCCPTDDGLRPSPLRFVISSLRSDTSVSVSGEPSAGDNSISMDSDDIPYSCPPTYHQQSAMIAELTDRKNGSLARLLLDKLIAGELTPRIARDLIQPASEVAT